MFALSTTNIRLNESYCFYSFITLIFVMSSFCSNYSSTFLWHSVSIFPENLLILSHDFCYSRQRISFEYTVSVQFIFQLAPNLLNAVQVRTFGVPVDNFQCSADHSFYRFCNGQFNKKQLKPL